MIFQYDDSIMYTNVTFSSLYECFYVSSTQCKMPLVHLFNYDNVVVSLMWQKSEATDDDASDDEGMLCEFYGFLISSMLCLHFLCG